MFNEEELTKLDIGVSYFLESEQNHLRDVQDNLDWEEARSEKDKDLEMIEDYKEQINYIQNKIDELQLLQIKVKRLKLGIG